MLPLRSRVFLAHVGPDLANPPWTSILDSANARSPNPGGIWATGKSECIRKCSTWPFEDFVYMPCLIKTTTVTPNAQKRLQHSQSTSTGITSFDLPKRLMGKIMQK